MGSRITLRDTPSGERLIAGVLFRDGVAENVRLSPNLRGFFEQPIHGATIVDFEVPEVHQPPATGPSSKGRKPKPIEQPDVTTIDLAPGMSGDEVAAAIIGG